MINYYSYGNIVRVMKIDENSFKNSVMIDVNTDEMSVLSVFDAKEQFDSDFIKSYLNILSNSKVGFRLLTKSQADRLRHDKANEILEFQKQKNPTIASLLSNCV